MSVDPLTSDLPPFELRPHRRMIPELELPALRRRPAPPQPRRSKRPAPTSHVRRKSERLAAVTRTDSRAGLKSDAIDAIDAESPALYWRVLRLRHLRPNGWQRALFVEGAVAVAVILALAGAASIWILLALPVAVACVVKANDVLLGELAVTRALAERTAQDSTNPASVDAGSAERSSVLL